MTSRDHMLPRLGPTRPPYLVEIFAISAAALVLEISYTRIISFKLYYYYTYLVIGLALLGLGSGAVLVAVSGRLAAWPTRSLLRGLSLAAAAAVVAGYVDDRRHAPRHAGAVEPGPVAPASWPSLQLLGICLGLYVSFLPIGMMHRQRCSPAVPTRSTGSTSPTSPAQPWPASSSCR